LKKYKKDKMFIMVKRRVSNLYVIQSRHANLRYSHAEFKIKMKKSEAKMNRSEYTKIFNGKRYV
jgi:hypothetical protein